MTAKKNLYNKYKKNDREEDLDGKAGGRKRKTTGGQHGYEKNGRECFVAGIEEFSQKGVGRLMASKSLRKAEGVSKGL